MPFGIQNYGPPPMIEDEIEDKELLAPPPQLGSITSPGQPTGKSGGFNWKAAGGAAIAAPLVAMLAEKLSGGKVRMGEALAALGGGFLDQKLTMMKEKRHQGIQEENRMLDLAHDSVKGLSNLTPETLAKFPKLQSLSQKYQEALASDGRITPKEASEIITQYQMAAADMALAQREQRGGQVLQDAGALQRQNLAIAREGGVANIANLMPQPGEDVPQDEADYIRGGHEDRARRMLLDREMQEQQRGELVPFMLGGQKVMGTRTEALRAISEAEERRHAMKMEELRANSANRSGDTAARQGALASYQSDLMEWQQAQAAALATVDDDPDLKAEIINEFRRTMPRKGDYVLGGPPPKVDRGTLDSIVDKYVSPELGAGSQPQQIQFQGKIYNSFEELPPEGKQKFLARQGR